MGVNSMIKGLSIGFIVLFIGIGIQPVFAEESITSTLDNEDCIECQVSDGYILLKVRLLLFKVKHVTNIISSSSLRDTPEVKKDCQEILDIIDSSISVDYPIICDILILYDSIITIIWLRIDSYREYFIEKGNHLIAVVFEIYLDILNYLHELIWEDGYYLDCDWIPPWYEPSNITKKE
jgi:hypothetical protein